MLEESPRIILALIAVLGMIGVAAVIARKAGLAAPAGAFTRKKRLALVETLALDARRRVAIIKCDDTEHLILLGATSEAVIDTNLTPVSEAVISETADGDAPPQTAPGFMAIADIAQKLRATSRSA